MSPADARRFIARMMTPAPGARHLSTWDRLQLSRPDLSDRDAVRYAEVMRAHLVCECPSVFAPAVAGRRAP